MTEVTSSPSPTLPAPISPPTTTSLDVTPVEIISAQSDPPTLPTGAPKDSEPLLSTSTSTPPIQPDIPSSDSHEIMSEGHSDWEKVEKPIASPPKVKAVKSGLGGAKKEEGGFKGKVGEVKRVLKTGMFGMFILSLNSILI